LLSPRGLQLTSQEAARTACRSFKCRIAQLGF